MSNQIQCKTHISTMSYIEKKEEKKLNVLVGAQAGKNSRLYTGNHQNTQESIVDYSMPALY